EKRVLFLVLVLVALCLAMSILACAQANGRLILGQSGSVSGALTLMPPDGTGWYHIDNPGNQMLRISGGGQPGQYLYMTISHPGKITVHGDLEVTGVLLTKRQVRTVPPPAPSVIRPVQESGGKADSATPEDVRLLQRKFDELTAKVNELITK